LVLTLLQMLYELPAWRSRISLSCHKNYSSYGQHRSSDATFFFISPKLFVLIVCVAWRHSGWGVGLVIGDRGFKPSRWTVESDLGQIIYTHLPLSKSGIILAKAHKLDA